MPPRGRRSTSATRTSCSARPRSTSSLQPPRRSTIPAPTIASRPRTVPGARVAPDGTLKGDLILVAQGDLSLGGRTGPDGTFLFENHDHSYASGNPEAGVVSADPLAGLDHLAREVLESGIKAVSGDVLIDDRL